MSFPFCSCSRGLWVLRAPLGWMHCLLIISKKFSSPRYLQGAELPDMPVSRDGSPPSSLPALQWDFPSQTPPQRSQNDI